MPARNNKRLMFGVFLLILVDLIWVLSNELTKFLYQNENYDKPFFCTYFKTSMFAIYLLFIGFLAPFQEQINNHEWSADPNYTRLGPNENDGSLTETSSGDNNGTSLDHTFASGPSENVCNDDTEHFQRDTAMSTSVASPNVEYSRFSDSIFVPIKECSHSCDEDDDSRSVISKVRRKLRLESKGSSGSCSSSSTSDADPSVRSVRFNKMAEVRQLSPLEAREALMSRLSYSASIRMHRQKAHHKTARIALMFAVLWFLANYLYQLALEPSEAALVTVLSSTSNLFTLLLAAVFPAAIGDRLTLSKCLAVFLSIGGVALICWSEINTDDKKLGRGIVMALLSAFFYAAYLVLVKRKSETEERVNIPLFFGFVGLWNFLIMWPIFIVLNYSHHEDFELPDKRQFLILFLNGLVGTVISEALWLWGCFLTSSLIGTLTMTLQIPMAMLMDVLLRGKVYSLMFYLGSIPIAVAILFVAILLNYDDGDPVLRILKLAYRKLFKLRWRQQVLRVNNESDDEQNECLIDGNGQDLNIR